MGSHQQIDLIWGIYSIETPEKEYQFHPARRWRFDYAWVGRKIAVEIDGGAWVQGRHNRAMGFLNDAEKFNEASKLGWRIFHFTPRQLKTGEAQTFMKSVFMEGSQGIINT